MDRKSFNDLMLNGTDKDILNYMVTLNPDMQGYQIARDVLNFRKTEKLVIKTWWIVFATWVVALATVFTPYMIKKLCLQ